MSITNFIEKIQGQEGVCLCIVEGVDFTETIKTLESNKFKLFDMQNFSSGNYYAILTEGNAKELYSFACEYPTGQVSFLNNDGERKWYTPDYELNAFVFVATLALISELQEKGFDFLSVCGMTYQK